MRRLFGIYLLVVFSQSLFGQASNALNKRPVELDSSGNYSFIVSGHFYGDGSSRSGYPANTILANLDWFNETDAVMMICLGDLFMDVKNDIPKYESSLFRKLEMPLFNAVGNHDLSGTVYQDHFGATWFKFKMGNDWHIILDTETANGDIEGEQLKMLQEVLADAKSNKVKNVFIYGHRTLWVDSYPEMEGMFKDNTQSVTSTNFESEILPVISEMAIHSDVHWFAGSLGSAPASFFYHFDKTRNLTYIATAIRALQRDAVLLVHVNNGIARFETHSLTGQQLEPLESYNVDFWKSTSAEEPFNYKLIPLYIKNALLSRYFWYGTAFAFLFSGAVWFWRRRRKKA